MESGRPPTHMLSFLFRTRARLERELAVERIRREFLERDLDATRKRAVRAETALERYVDQALASRGVIHSPLRDPVVKPPASPYVGVMAAMSRDTLTTPPNSEAPMPDS